MDSREPGRALDREIAEKVFGWKWYALTIENGDVRRMLFMPDTIIDWWQRNYNAIPSKGNELEIEPPPDNFPEYSTSLAAAEEILTHYQEKGHWWQINTPTKASPFYRALLWEKGALRTYGCHKAVSIAHAVCLAALEFEEEKRR